MAQRRYHQIDLLRSVACVMVVAFHYLCRGHQGGWVPFASPESLRQIVKFGYLGVPLFFAISGFVIFLSVQKGDARTFVASRAARLYPAFWVAIILTTAVVRWGGDVSLLVPWRDVLINFTMVPQWLGADLVDGAYWSLAVEFHFYIFVWLLLRFDVLRHIKSIMWVWLFVSFFNYFQSSYLIERLFEASWAPFFCVGICAYLMREGDRTQGVHLLFLFAAVLVLMYVRSRAGQVADFSDRDVAAAVLLGSLVPVAFWLISRQKFEVAGGSVLYWAATLTYPVYVLHEYMGYVLMSRLHGLGVAPAICVVVVFSGVLVMAYQVHIRVERPLAGLIRKVVAGG